jgi:hypothetical protein
MTYTPPDRFREHFSLNSTGCPTAELDNIVATCLKNMFGLLKENLGKPLIQCLLVFWYIPVRRTDTPTSGLWIILPYLTADKSAKGALSKGMNHEGLRLPV